MNANGKDMFTDPRFADHRAPVTPGRAFLNGAIGGIIIGVGLAVVLAIVSIIV